VMPPRIWRGTVASGPKVPPAGSRVEPLSRPDGCRKCSKAINPGITDGV
jgi:hypothetical protein